MQMYVTTIQERQMLAMRKFYPKPRKLSVVDEIPELEKTRLYEPFDVDTVQWIARQFALGVAPDDFAFGRDGETGRGYIEF